MTIWIGTKQELRSLSSGRLVEGSIGALAHDDAAADDDEVWAVVNEREIWRGPERVASAPLDVTSLTVRGGVLLAGTATARLLTLERGKLAFVEGFDALDRRSWGTPWGGPPDVFSTAILDDGAWLAGVHVGGVWRSEDRGLSWREVLAIDADDHQIAARGAEVVIACGGGPIAVSHDGGRSFTFPRAGLPHSYGTAVALARAADTDADADSDDDDDSDAEDVVVLACSPGPFANKSALVRGVRGAFAPALATSANVHALAARGATVACADDSGRVWTSPDAGASWRDEGALGARSLLVT